jgi:hypothetical protein
MHRMIAHAKSALDHRRDPPSRPHITPEAMRLGSLGQQCRDLRSLLGRQP